VPETTGLYWVSDRGYEMWEPALVIISKDGPAASSVMQIGSDLPCSISDYEFGPKIEPPAGIKSFSRQPDAFPKIPLASGETLDRLGELNAVTRADGESDQDFRARILQTFRDREAQARRDFFAHLGPGPFAPPPPETRAEWEALYKNELGNPL
jgi:hypothetical protein